MATSTPAHSDEHPGYPLAPLITHLRITGFQSLHDIDLDLSPFTVIVGPSSSGKSALVRAIKTLTNNARGTAYITHGFTKTTLSADFTDDHGPKGSVTLTRGTGTKAEHNAYVLTPPDIDAISANAPEAVFTKLAGEVPDEVQDFMSLPNDPALTLAGQFDKPYLLDASPTEVARTLASLTNVHTIFNAAREANRVRLAQSATLRTRTTDLEAIRLRTEEFRTLATRRIHQAAAEASIERAQQIAAQIERLSSLLTFHESATRGAAHYATLASVTIPDLDWTTKAQREIHYLADAMTREHDAAQTLDAYQGAAHAQIPAIEPVQAAHERLSAYRATLVALRTAREACKAHQVEIIEHVEAWGQAQDAYIGALTAIGTCPTCGQDTKHIDHTSVEKIHA